MYVFALWLVNLDQTWPNKKTGLKRVLNDLSFTEYGLYSSSVVIYIFFLSSKQDSPLLLNQQQTLHISCQLSA